MKPGQILGLENPLPDCSINPLCYPAVTPPPASKSFLLLHGCSQWISFTDELAKITDSSGTYKAFQRLHYKVENTFGFLDALDDRSSNSCISEDQSGLCHTITYPEKLLTEAANNAANFSSALSLLLDPRLVCTFVQVKNATANMLCPFPLGNVRRQM